ncbi:CHAD domain-containing protein [Curtobacterium sp. 9128]|uniref:CYTH and CHAD domain-containing protein n=1 Tax=Curtobacterium sp. 9128 TaxID=1793722 RepID=UPI001642A8F8|nr:CHAD domain-containing protein [Curtobacterium sp. 9128]
METTDTTTIAGPHRTWRVPDDRRLPALEPYADRVDRASPVTVRETVWDTDDRALAFAGIELLRVEGTGSPPSWYVDRGAGPVSLSDDLDRPPTADVTATDAVPTVGAPVPRDAVEVVLRGRAVRPVRVRDTTTTLVLLRGRDGRVRAEVADVQIDEGDTDSAMLTSGRWWALSAGVHAGAVVRSAERALSVAAEDAGQTAGDPVPRLAPVRRPAAPRSRPPRSGTAAAFVHGALVDLRQDLMTIDPLVRADEHGSVHAFRTVIRRMRSVLVVFRGALDRDATEALRARLAEVGRVAGTARDAEVLGERLLRSAARSPEGYVGPQTLERLVTELEGARGVAAAALRRTLRTDTWFGALDTLDHLIEAAPPGRHTREDAAEFVTRRIVRERARLSGTLGRASDDLTHLHETRKAARRLRHALQASGDLADVGKRRLGRLRRIQDTLGDALDAAHAAEALRRSAADAGAGGQDTFGYGVLATTERHTADERTAQGLRLLRGL